MNNFLSRYQNLLEKLVLGGIIIAALYLLVKYAWPLAVGLLGIIHYFAPFILAIIITFLIDPLVNWVQLKFRLGRGLAVFLTLLSFSLVIGLGLTLVITRLIVELTNLSQGLPELTQNLSLAVSRIVDWLQRFYQNLPPEVVKTLQDNIGGVVNASTDLLTAAVTSLYHAIAALPGLLTIGIVALIATYFFSRDSYRIRKTFLGLFPAAWQHRVTRVGNDLGLALTGFIRAQAVLISITMVISITGLGIFGVEFAATVGVLVGLADILPILGPGIVFIPWALYSLFFGSTVLGIKLLILYGLVVVVRQVVEPRILAQNIGLHPLATLVALYVGLKALGVAGVILGPALLILIKSASRAGFFNGK